MGEKRSGMPTDNPISVLHHVLEALAQGDWSIFDTHPGLSETREHFPRLHAAFPDLRYTIDTEFGAGEFIACVVTMHGTHLGPYQSLAPTGTSVSFLVLMIDRIVDGKIVEHWALPDFMSLFQQLGGMGPFPPPLQDPT
jgi:predicted ester cyclase